MDVNKIENARALPKEWDHLAEDYFQTREFLTHTESYNPCQQRYYVGFQDESFVAGAIVYTLRLDLLTYLSIKSPLKMNIVGVPCSVSCSGLVGYEELYSVLLESMKREEKGFLLVLNRESRDDIPEFIQGRTLPTIIFKNRFFSWDDYVQSLRSHYKRRLVRLSDSFKGVRVTAGPCSRFDQNMYLQYREVLKRSSGKLETLSLPFFQNLPSRFKLTTYSAQNTLAGWHISLRFREKFYFFLGGLDYDLNKQFRTYFNMLYAILREGIESKASFIDLGQTAEFPKLLLGGMVVEKSMLAFHSNWLFRKALDACSGILEYSRVIQMPHVLKEIT